MTTRMNWQIFFTSFFAVLVAELGDKTQITAMMLSSQSQSTLSVLLGVVLALMLSGVIGVIAGQLLHQYLDPVLIKKVSGFIFLVMGAWILIR